MAANHTTTIQLSISAIQAIVGVCIRQKRKVQLPRQKSAKAFLIPIQKCKLKILNDSLKRLKSATEHTSVEH